MKKFLLMFSILFTAVVCTACINNLAIQELNNKAKDYISAGEPEKAICRLKSSLDLDNNFFETNYNLAIAYMEIKDYKNALPAIEHAIKLNPDFPDGYYVLGQVYENLADTVLVQDDENDLTFTNNPTENVEENEISVEDAKTILNYYNKSLDAYNIYLSKIADAQAKHDTEVVINNIKQEMLKYTNLGISE